MVGAQQALGPDAARHGDGGVEGAVAPADLLRIFSLRVGRIDDQQIDRADRRIEFGLTLLNHRLVFGVIIVFRRIDIEPGLVVAGEEDRFPVAFDTVAKVGNGVVHQHRCHFRIADHDHLAQRLRDLCRRKSDRQILELFVIQGQDHKGKVLHILA